MRKLLWTGILAALVMVSLALSFALPVGHAQEGYTAQDAIDLAAAHPAFAGGLAARPGWTAAAYDSQNKYGIWHVEFWDASGKALGWADLSLARGKVYSWESRMELMDEQVPPAETAIRAFLSSNTNVLALVGSLGDTNVYVDYDIWNEWWTAYIDLGPDSLYITIRSTSGVPSSLEDLQLDRINFPNLPSYDEWYKAHEAQAIIIAFQQPEITAALRSITGWKASGALGEDGLWRITFVLDTKTLATATVTLDPQQVLEFEIAES